MKRRISMRRAWGGGKLFWGIRDRKGLSVCAPAVMGVVKSFTGYQGQKCSACSRAVVHESVYELFLRRLTDAVMSLRMGPPEDPSNVLGPMIDGRALAKVQEYIEIGREEGGIVVMGQKREPGYFITPTIVADMQPTHRLAREEIFGPVLA